MNFTKGILNDPMLKEIFQSLIEKCNTCKHYQKKYDYANKHHYLSDLPSIIIKRWMEHLEEKRGHLK